MVLVSSDRVLGFEVECEETPASPFCVDLRQPCGLPKREEVETEHGRGAELLMDFAEVGGVVRGHGGRRVR
ncbi:hypothetical protein HPP92_004014 [Vanilla planifolia]|uniref:Uncharacterized protein n=1 Tax=Vanilla planifolia TaxID=51239 RepID=A0A835SHH5_VANPL|nr:hypothetical protein HPP92_004014 [Vanilla planifolia]